MKKKDEIQTTPDGDSGRKKKGLPPKARTALRAAAFLLVLLLVLTHVQSVLGISEQPAYTTIDGFYDERRDSLDAIYFGASNVHALWQPSFGWTKSGIAVRSYSLNSMPGVALKNMIIEARKTQPNALCIINLNSFKKSGVDYVTIHRCVDYLAPSLNKLDAIQRLSEEAGYPEEEQLEYIFPLIRFHSRWSETKSWDYYPKHSDIMTNRYYYSYLNTSVDLTSYYHTSDVSDDTLGEKQRAAFKELLAYLKETNARVLFLMVPQATAERTVTFMNSLGDLVKETGFPYVDLLNHIEETSLSITGDFKDKKHTNVHGAIKFSGYLTDYLVENYGFEDKRGQKGWEAWDSVTETYLDTISPFTLPFEREYAPRNYELKAPKMELSITDQTSTLKWSAVPGADGYQIYRKDGSGDWTLATRMDALEGEDVLSITETDLVPGLEYSYTVVPISIRDGEISYGRFLYSGIKQTVPLAEGQAAPEETREEREYEEP